MDDKAPSEENIDYIFQNRRSVRSFLPRELTDSELSEILEPLNWTPTGRNAQKIQVDVIRGRGNLQKLILCRAVRLLKVLDCFKLITLLAGSERGFVRRLKAGEDLITWGAPCAILFRTSGRCATPADDCLIAATSVAFKAEAMGMGTLWSGVVKLIAPLIGLGNCRAVLLAGFPGLKKYQYAPARNWIKREL